VIGALAGVGCPLAIKLKYRLGYDDSLDVVALHGMGGLLGTVLVGLFATMSANSAGANGLFYGGGLAQLGRQTLAALVAACYAFGVSMLLAWLVRLAIGFRVDREVEHAGIDEAEHAESGYDLSLLSSAGRPDTGGVASGAASWEAARPTQEEASR
jgi:ammonium transporter, Amt family